MLFITYLRLQLSPTAVLNENVDYDLKSSSENNLSRRVFCLILVEFGLFTLTIIITDVS